MSLTTYLDQTNSMLTELEHLRSHVRQQADLIGKLKAQYNELADRHLQFVRGHNEELEEMRIQRDLAKQSADEIEAVLNSAASHILQGMRARVGDREVPEPAPIDPPAPRIQARGMDGRPTAPLDDGRIALLSKSNQRALDDAMRAGNRITHGS